MLLPPDEHLLRRALNSSEKYVFKPKDQAHARLFPIVKIHTPDGGYKCLPLSRQKNELYTVAKIVARMMGTERSVYHKWIGEVMEAMPSGNDEDETFAVHLTPDQQNQDFGLFLQGGRGGETLLAGDAILQNVVSRWTPTFSEGSNVRLFDSPTERLLVKMVPRLPDLPKQAWAMKRTPYFLASRNSSATSLSIVDEDTVTPAPAPLMRKQRRSASFSEVSISHSATTLHPSSRPSGIRRSVSMTDSKSELMKQEVHRLCKSLTKHDLE